MCRVVLVLILAKNNRSVAYITRSKSHCADQNALALDVPTNVNESGLQLETKE
jgi:hypothetical protein